MSKQKIIDDMKQRVYDANIRLPQLGLVTLTWGNVSEINRDLGLVVIKPSGVDYEHMTKEDMVLTDLQGKVLEKNSLKPSSDLKTHLEIYRSFKDVVSVVHTHSNYAVSWAQTGRDLPVYGTTHADAFFGPVPNTNQLSEEEVEEDYERNTGKVIVETFQERNLDPIAIPGVLVNGHGPFTWGISTEKAVENSLILEEVCSMAQRTEAIQLEAPNLPQYILDKHYFRKHGNNAYYGQKNN